MKTSFILGAALAVTMSLSAGAADVYGPAPDAKAVTLGYSSVNWSGLYLGVNGGGGFATAFIDDKDCFNCDSDHTTGFFGVLGGQIGYNWQSRSFVYGVEADLDWASYDEKYILCTNCGGGQADAHNATKTDALASVRGRAGLAFDNTLPYVTAGVAFANMRNNYQYINDESGAVSNSWVDHSWHTGFVVGAGIEMQLNPRWVLRAEWLHYDFEQVLSRDRIGGAAERFGFGGQADVARLGLNYRPFVAEYVPLK